MPLLVKYHIEVHTVHIFLDEYHYERELAILTELAQKYHISWFVVKSPARLTKDVLDETAVRYRRTGRRTGKSRSRSSGPQRKRRYLYPREWKNSVRISPGSLR